MGDKSDFYPVFRKNFWEQGYNDSLVRRIDLDLS